jgi:hypothetical protein
MSEGDVKGAYTGVCALSGPEACNACIRPHMLIPCCPGSAQEVALLWQELQQGLSEGVHHLSSLASPARLRSLITLPDLVLDLASGSGEGRAPQGKQASALALITQGMLLTQKLVNALML